MEGTAPLSAAILSKTPLKGILTCFLTALDCKVGRWAFHTRRRSVFRLEDGNVDRDAISRFLVLPG